MNRLKLVILVMLCCITRTSNGQIKVSNDALVFDNSAQNSTIVTIDAGDDWTVSTNADWLLVEKVTSGMLSIATQTANESIKERKALITLTRATETKNITVSQEAAEPMLTLSQHEVTFPYKGSNEIISVSANMKWKITESPKWCAINVEDGDIHISVKKNDTKKSRSGVILIKGELETVTINVKQRGNGIFDKMKDTVDDVI